MTSATSNYRYIFPDHPAYPVPNYPDIHLLKPTNALKLVTRKCYNYLTATPENRELFQLNNLEQPLDELRTLILVYRVPQRITSPLVITTLAIKPPNDYTDQDFQNLYMIGATLYQEFFAAEWMAALQFGIKLYNQEVV